MPHPLIDQRVSAAVGRCTNPALIRAMLATDLDAPFSRDAQSSERSAEPPNANHRDDSLYERCTYCATYAARGRTCPICQKIGFIKIGMRRAELVELQLKSANIDHLAARFTDLAEAMDVTPADALDRAAELLEETLWNQPFTLLEDPR